MQKRAFYIEENLTLKTLVFLLCIIPVKIHTQEECQYILPLLYFLKTRYSTIILCKNQSKLYQMNVHVHKFLVILINSNPSEFLQCNLFNFNLCKLLNISCHYGIKVWWLQQRWIKIKVALSHTIDSKLKIRDLEDILLFYSKCYAFFFECC